MKTLYIDKLKTTHVIGGLFCCGFLYWMLKGQPLQTSSTWQPKASFILNQKLENTEYYLSRKTVPKIIHQTWRDNKVPEMTAPWIRGCHEIHKDWEYWYWTDDDIRQLIVDLYPQFLKLFDSYPAGGYRGDAFRYFVLYEYGGVYMDIDMECLKPLDPLITKHDCILSQEPVEHAHFLSPLGVPLVSNAFMACNGKHPFFGHVIENLHSYYGWLNWNDILRATGPYMLTEEYRYYIRDGFFMASEAHKHPIHLGEADEFQPSTDPSMRDHLREACVHSKGHSFIGEEYKARQEELCNRILQQGFAENPPQQAYTDHHWTHTWAGQRNDPYNIIGTDQYVDVRELMQSKRPG